LFQYLQLCSEPLLLLIQVLSRKQGSNFAGKLVATFEMETIYSLFIILFIKSAFGVVSYSGTYSYDATSTVWNPLKGFVPYYYGTSSQPAVNFPHSMENQYIPMKDLMLGPNSFDFSSIDTVLMNVASRNHHAIIRVYVDYPGQNLSLSLPDFLWNGLT
jgi:hypothetical protein